jgi:hypothetical protein
VVVFGSRLTTMKTTTRGMEEDEERSNITTTGLEEEKTKSAKVLSVSNS